MMQRSPRLALPVLAFALIGSAVSAEPLRIATGGHYPPYILDPETPQARGLDKELLDAICDLGGFDCTFVDLPMSDIFQALARGDVDIVGGGFGYSAERDAIVDFTCPYVISGEGSGLFVAAAPDVDLIEARIGVLVSSLFQNAMEQAGRDAVPFETEEAALAALMRGDIDVVFGSENMVDLAQSKGNFYQIGTYPTFSLGTAFAVSEDAPGLRSTLNSLLAELSANGTLGEIQTRWIGRNEGDVIAQCHAPINLT